MAKKFDYQGAKKAGYSDEEITSHLTEIHPKFDYQSAIDSGYSPEEVNEYLSTYKPERSGLQKAGRIAGQFAIGAAENALLPYELATIPLHSKQAQHGEYRQNLFQDIERLQEQKAMGQWDQQDEELYNNLVEQVKNPEKAMEHVQTANIGIRGLAEKATGLDLHPEGILEKAASWRGILTKPQNAKELVKIGLKPKQVLNFFTNKEMFRSLGAGAALEMAEDGDLGPIGTIASAIIGDIIGGKGRNLIKSAAEFVKSPKQSLAKTAAKFTPKEKLGIQKEVIDSFRENGIQADIGTLTDSKLMQWAQARINQSALSGEGPEQLKKSISDQIKSEYKAVADSLGEARFQTLNEAGEIGKEAINKVRDADKQVHTDLYAKFRKRLSDESNVKAGNTARAISKMKQEVTPGALKSPEQAKLLDALETLEKDIFDARGNIKETNLKDLLNNKIALQDIVDFEIQGGQKQRLKHILEELERDIISYGRQDKEALKLYADANKKFSEHVKTYRNDNINRILMSKDPMTLMNKMNTPQGIKDVRNALIKTSEGKNTFNELARAKFDQLVGSKMTDNISEQVKTGKFSNLLQNPKNAQLISELLPKDSYRRLLSLMKNAGKLASTAQKFFNASKSGTTLIDVALIGDVLHSLSMLAAGNPFPFLKTASIGLTARSISKLIYDPMFLRYVEDAIKASEHNDTSLLMKIGELMEQVIKNSLGPSLVQGAQQGEKRG